MAIEKLIINADDFGRNANVNQAVIRSFEQYFCSNTTIMANMPGFEEAVELAHQHQFADRVGLHLNLSDGIPLTDDIKRSARICDREGVFLAATRKPLLTLSTDERDVLNREINAQVARCRRAGLGLSHVDSHCHVHNEWGVTKTLIKIVRGCGIKHIRVCRHRDPASRWWKNLYRAVVNFKLRSTGLAGTDYFGTLEDAIRLHKQISRPFTMEVMLHPALDKDDRLIDFFLPGALQKSIERLLLETAISPLELTSYKQVHNRLH